MPDILVIDDHPVNLQLMRGQLGLLGLQADCTPDPTEGFELWRKGQYRLVITDIHMAGMTGHDLARAIRDIEAERGITAGVPIIAWTADALPANLQACLDAGMNGHLVKPTLLEPLSRMIETWLGPQAKAAAPARPAPATAATGPAERATPGVINLAGVIDEAALREFSDGDPVLEREIFNEFRAANQRDLAALRESVALPDREMTRMVAHRIKGACRILGATALANLFEEIEHASRADGDWNRVGPALERVGFEIERLEHFIRLRTTG